MRFARRAVFFVTAILALTAVRAIEERETISADRLRLKEILRRVDDQNQSTALLDVGKLDPEVAIPVLTSFALARTTNSENSGMAIAALKKIRGLDGYFKRHVSALLQSSTEQHLVKEAFDVLALVANREAASAAAQFLFDESEPVRRSPDVGDSPVRWQAAFALTKMQLPDAPVSKPFYELSENDLQKWRNWAVEGKLVNRSVDLGHNVAETSPPSMPAPAATPALSPQPATPVAQARALPAERESPVWPWLVGILALASIVALVFKRRA